MEDNPKTYTEFILALLKKAVETEENYKSCRPLTRAAANIMHYILRRMPKFS